MEKPRINIADLMREADRVYSSLSHNEQITEEDRNFLHRIFPVKVAYDELMRQMGIYNENK